MERINKFHNTGIMTDSSFKESSVSNLLDSIVSIIDDRIKKRLSRSDIMQLYDGKILKIYNDNSALVEYADYTYDIANGTGVAFTDDDIGKYVKFGTVDRLNYICVFRISPKSINIDEINKKFDNVLENLSETTEIRR